MNDEAQNLELTVLSQIPDSIATIASWLQSEWPDDLGDAEASSFLETHAEGGESLPIGLVVLANDEPIGFVSVQGQPDEPGPILSKLYVIPESRERGIGRLLVTTASRVAWQLGFEKVYAITAATELMKALGWSSTHTVERDGREMMCFEYEKPPAPPSYYERIGGEEKVRELVDRFYDLMDTNEDAREIRDMHAKSLRSSRQKLFEFLSGWMGGPNLYIEKRGHPRLRMRHMPFSIGTEARDQWLMCMDQALDEVVEDEATREELRDSFVRIADHMRNRRGP